MAAPPITWRGDISACCHIALQAHRASGTFVDWKMVQSRRISSRRMVACPQTAFDGHGRHTLGPAPLGMKTGLPARVGSPPQGAGFAAKWMRFISSYKSSSQLRCILVSRLIGCLGKSGEGSCGTVQIRESRLASNLRNPVDRRTLSTGEDGEFEGESVASDPNPGGAGCSPSDGFLKRRERQTQVLAKCLGYERLKKAMQSMKTGLKVGVGEVWLPALNPPGNPCGRTRVQSTGTVRGHASDRRV